MKKELLSDDANNGDVSKLYDFLTNHAKTNSEISNRTIYQPHESHLQYQQLPILTLSDIQKKLQIKPNQGEKRKPSGQSNQRKTATRKKSNKRKRDKDESVKQKRKKCKSVTVTPQEIFAPEIETEKKIKKNYSNSFFRSYTTHSGLMDVDVKILWHKIKGFIQENEFVNAVLCCSEGYKLSFNPNLILDIENPFADLINSYFVYKPVDHIEFARLEACIINYLWESKKIDDLFKLALYGNEVALHYLSRVSGTKIDRLISKKLKLYNENNNETIMVLKLCKDLDKNCHKNRSKAVEALEKIQNLPLKALLHSRLILNILFQEEYVKEDYEALENSFMILINDPEIHYLNIRTFSTINQLQNFFSQKNNDIAIKLRKIGLFKGDVFYSPSFLRHIDAEPIVDIIRNYFKTPSEDDTDTSSQNCLENSDDDLIEKAIREKLSKITVNRLMANSITLLNYENEALRLFKSQISKDEDYPQRVKNDNDFVSNLAY